MDFWKNKSLENLIAYIPYNQYIGDYRCNDTHLVKVLEEWKEIPKTDNKYIISNLGRVKSIKSNKILAQIINHRGYLKVAHFSKSVHKLQALAFIDNIENKEPVNHKFPDKTLNIPSNLEWMTNQENIQHSIKYRIFISGSTNGIAPRKGKKVHQLSMDGTIIKEWDKMIDINEPKGVSTVCVSLVCRGKQPSHKGFIWRYAS